MIARCTAVPGFCDRCGSPASDGVLCEPCTVGGPPARPHPQRCQVCDSWVCSALCPTRDVGRTVTAAAAGSRVFPVVTSFKKAA